MIDFNTLQQKINLGGLESLISYCDNYEQSQPDATTKEAIQLVKSAIMVSSFILHEDKKALAHQLVGRLMLHRRHNPLIKQFTDWIVENVAGIYPLSLESDYAVLFPAGSIFHRILEIAHQTWNAIQLSNGNVLSCGKHPNPMRLWTADGALIKTLEGHTDDVFNVKQLANGNIISHSADTTLRLWDIDGNPIKVLEGHVDKVFDVIQLRSGNFVSSSANSKELGRNLIMWDADGNFMKLLEGHRYNVYDAIELSTGNIISRSSNYSSDVGSYDTDLILWDENGNLLKNLEGHTDTVGKPLELKNGNILSWCMNDFGQDLTPRLWDKDGNLVAILDKYQAYISGVILLETGNILTYGPDGILIWDENGQFVSRPEIHTRSVLRVIQLKTGNLLSWSHEGILKIWTPDGKILYTMEHWIYGAVELVDGRLLSFGERLIKLWSSDGQLLQIIEGTQGGHHRILELDNGKILVWNYKDTLQLWDLSKSSVQFSAINNRKINKLIKSRDNLVFSSTHLWQAGTKTHLWDNQGALLRTFDNELPTITDIKRYETQGFPKFKNLESEENLRQLIKLIKEHGFAEDDTIDTDYEITLHANVLSIRNKHTDNLLKFYGDKNFFDKGLLLNNHFCLVDGGFGRPIFLQFNFMLT
jgi:hypothetical protein